MAIGLKALGKNRRAVAARWVDDSEKAHLFAASYLGAVSELEATMRAILLGLELAHRTRKIAISLHFEGSLVANILAEGARAPRDFATLKLWQECRALWQRFEPRELRDGRDETLDRLYDEWTGYLERGKK